MVGSPAAKISPGSCRESRQDSRRREKKIPANKISARSCRESHHNIPANPQSTKIWRQPQKFSKRTFFLDFTFFQCNDSTLSTKLMNKKCKKSHGQGVPGRFGALTGRPGDFMISCFPLCTTHKSYVSVHIQRSCSALIMLI